MLQIFIQVLEFSLSAAIVVGLVFGVCLRGRPAKKEKRALLVAAVLGVAAALTVAILRRTTAWINMGFWSTVGMLIALAGSVLFLFRAGAETGQKPGGRRVSLVGGALFIAAVLFYTLPKVFLIPSSFLTAEESAASTEFLFKCASYLAAMLFVVLTASITGKTALSYNPVQSRPAHSADVAGQPARVKTGVDVVKMGCALAVVIELLNNMTQIVQFLFARRVIPINRDVFMAVAFLRNNSVIFLFAEIAALLMFAAAVFILASLEKRSNVAGNPAERRKALALFRGKRRRFAFITVLACFSLVTLTALKAWTEKTVSLSPPESYLLENGEISIGLDQISDGHLHRFAWTASENVEVRFIVIKKNETSFGVGLDACDICGATGYYERKDDVICMLCDVVMNKNTIGFKGGCNPVPLAYTIHEGNMVVRCEDLENERSRFQ
ncbi:MAG: Fe-S-containing protein [Spirochaetaceae bacterium]|jgi:uncharacterized membrane protein|nr:Fe-S-containing protein [Spirochaetaceae bacterium]